MTTKQLIGLSIDPVVAWFKRQIILVRLSWLYSDADYFREQTHSGTVGLQKTHKLIALLESDLRRIK